MMNAARWLCSWKIDYHFQVNGEFGSMHLGPIAIPYFVLRMKTVRPFRIIQEWPKW